MTHFILLYTSHPLKCDTYLTLSECLRNFSIVREGRSLRLMNDDRDGIKVRE